jgi:hypothetical protein
MSLVRRPTDDGVRFRPQRSNREVSVTIGPGFPEVLRA